MMSEFFAYLWIHKATIGSIVGGLTGPISLFFIFYDRAKKGAKVIAVLRLHEFDGQTQHEGYNGGPLNDVHYCIFKFGIRLENHGNEACTLTDVEIQSRYEHEQPVEVDFNGEQDYLLLQPGTGGFFSVENRATPTGEPPVSPIAVRVKLKFIGHKPISIPINFEFAGNRFRRTRIPG